MLVLTNAHHSPLRCRFTATVAILLNCSTPGAFIYYTMDGSMPIVPAILGAGGGDSSTQLYSALLVWTKPGTSLLRAVCAKGNWTTSLVRLETYVVLSQTQAPQFTPAGGSFTRAVRITLETPTDNATMYYTTDGSTPTAQSSVHAAGTQLEWATVGRTTFRAIAKHPNMTTSQVTEQVFVVLSRVATPVVAAPVFARFVRLSVLANMNSSYASAGAAVAAKGYLAFASFAVRGPPPTNESYPLAVLAATSSLMPVGPWSAHATIDGDTSTCYSARLRSSRESIVYDLGQPVPVFDVRVRAGSAHACQQRGDRWEQSSGGPVFISDTVQRWEVETSLVSAAGPWSMQVPESDMSVDAMVGAGAHLPSGYAASSAGDVSARLQGDGVLLYDADAEATALAPVQLLCATPNATIHFTACVFTSVDSLPAVPANCVASSNHSFTSGSTLNFSRLLRLADATILTPSVQGEYTTFHALCLNAYADSDLPPYVTGILLVFRIIASRLSSNESFVNTRQYLVQHRTPSPVVLVAGATNLRTFTDEVAIQITPGAETSEHAAIVPTARVTYRSDGGQPNQRCARNAKSHSDCDQFRSDVYCCDVFVARQLLFPISSGAN